MLARMDAGLSTPRASLARSASRVRRHLSTDAALRRAVIAVVGLRIVLGAVAAITARWFPRDPGFTIDPGLGLSTNGVTGWLLTPWQRDDAFSYERIAVHGYGHDPTAAFMPVFPLLEHAAGVVLGGAWIAGGLLVSSIALAVALVLLDRLVGADVDPATARRTVLLVAIAPWALFLVAPFTESTFLALSVGAFLAARRRRHVAAGGLAALAALTRPQGVLLMVPLAVEVIAEARDRRAQGRPALRPAHAAVLLPAVALGVFEGVLAWRLGLAHGTLSAQSDYWGVRTVAPWTAIADSVRTVATGVHPEEAFNLVAVALCAASLPTAFRRLPPAYGAYAAAMLLPILLHENTYSPLMSAGRFLLVVFPVAVVAAMWLRRPRALRLATSLCATLLVVFTIDYVRFHFVG